MRARWLMPALLASLAVASLSCGDSTSPQTGTAVMVKDNEFEPRNLQVTAGQTVTWTWTGSNQHNVTFDDASIGNSTTQTSGQFAKAFPTAGAFPYHCTIHGLAMSGTITVQ